MGRNRKTFTETFKKEVAIEALKERMPVHEIATKFGISPSMVSNWKKDFISGGFSKEIQEMKKENESNKEKIDELYKELGKAKMENELLKKKWNL